MHICNLILILCRTEHVRDENGTSRVFQQPLWGAVGQSISWARLLLDTKLPFCLTIACTNSRDEERYSQVSFL